LLRKLNPGLKLLLTMVHWITVLIESTLEKIPLEEATRAVLIVLPSLLDNGLMRRNISRKETIPIFPPPVIFMMLDIILK